MAAAVIAMGVYFITMLYTVYIIETTVKRIRKEQGDIKKRLGKSRVREQKMLKAVDRKGVRRYAK